MTTVFGHPTHVTVEPSGRFVYVANLSSNDVSSFGIDLETGALIGTTASLRAANH